MDKKIETTIRGYIGTSMRIHSFIPSWLTKFKGKRFRIEAALRGRRFRIQRG